MTVDDLCLVASSVVLADWIEGELGKRLKMTFGGDLKWLIGFEIICDRPKCTIHLSQRHYIDTILHRFKMDQCNPSSTPMDPDIHYSATMNATTEDAKSEMANVPYHQAIGSLMFLAVGSRPDIAHSVY